tara:strand:+ start:6856 stop:7326 length:471 start_codon:yes stop_codon:yes gene_type:complete
MSYSKEEKKIYMKAWRKSNKEHIAAYSKGYREENRDRLAAQIKDWRVVNKEKINATAKVWEEANRGKRRAYAQNNKGICNARTARRRAAKLQATPIWFETEKATIKLMYEYATLMQAHVDHIVPLQNSKVCGLHTLNNLQLLTAEDNLTKSNKYSY